jgi:hypothetical protein
VTTTRRDLLTAAVATVGVAADHGVSVFSDTDAQGGYLERA